MAKRTVIEHWGLEAIIYSNATQTDQSTRLREWLELAPAAQTINVYALPIPGQSKDVMWVFSQRQLTPTILGDILADDWIDQTQMHIGDPFNAVVESLPKLSGLGDITTIAQQIGSYLSHREAQLDAMMEALAEDVKVEPTKWDPGEFARNLEAGIKAGLPFAKFLDHLSQIGFPLRVIATAMLIR